MKYAIEISPTAQGDQEYLQILSEDGFSVNVVLLGSFKVRDTRRGINPVIADEPEVALPKATVLLDSLALGPDEEHGFTEGQSFVKEGEDAVYEITRIEEGKFVGGARKVRVYGVRQI